MAAYDPSPEDFAARLAEGIERRDTAAVRSLVRRYYASELVREEGGVASIADAWLAEGDRYGPLAYRVSSREDGRPMAWLYGRVTGAWLGLKLFLDADASGSIIGVGIRRGTSPPGIDRGSPLSDAQLADSLASYMESMADNEFFSGAVLVARGDRVVHRSAHGMADPAASRRNTVETRFNLASAGKMFTGVAMASLARTGVLSLDDPLRRLVPEYPARVADAVRLRDLLTHTSGIELDDIAEFQDATYRARDVEGLLRAQLAFVDRLPDPPDPPLGFDYTNEGFNLAGMVIERASGRLYPEILRQAVFQPAGMLDTGTDYEASRPPVARGLTFEGGSENDRERHDNESFLPNVAMPAGAHYSTVGDLLHFARALRTNELLGTAWTDSVTAMKVVEAELPTVTYGYGFGFEVIDRDGFRSWGHSGGMPGASTKFEVYPELDLVIIVLSNWDGAATMVTNHVRSLTLRR